MGNLYTNIPEKKEQRIFFGHVIFFKARQIFKKARQFF